MSLSGRVGRRLGGLMDSGNVMRKVVNIVGLPILFCGGVALDATRPLAASGTVEICGGQPVPSGWVVVSWRNSMSCPGWSPSSQNQMVLQKPGSPQAVCADSPIPAGYVVASRGNSMSCLGWSPSSMNVLNIEIPGREATICDDSPVPAGYVLVGQSNSMSCLGWSPSSSNQKIIRKL